MSQQNFEIRKFWVKTILDPKKNSGKKFMVKTNFYFGVKHTNVKKFNFKFRAIMLARSVVMGFVYIVEERSGQKCSNGICLRSRGEERRGWRE